MKQFICPNARLTLYLHCMLAVLQGLKDTDKLKHELMPILSPSLCITGLNKDINREGKLKTNKLRSLSDLYVVITD